MFKQRKSNILKHFWRNANMNQKKTKIEHLINDDLEESSSENESDSEFDD